MKTENKRILLIEDDNLLKESLTLRLEQEGFEVVSAISARGGLEKLRTAGPFAVVLLDLLLPGEDGFWFLEEKRKEPDIANIVVVVISNSGDPSATERSMALGAKGYLIKANIDLRTMIKELVKCIETGSCRVDSSG